MGGRRDGRFGQGHSEFGARRTAAHRQEDLWPLHRGRHPGRGRRDGPPPERRGLRRHHRPSRGEHREQGRRGGQAQGLQEGRRRPGRARPRRRHLHKAHGPRPDPQRGVVQVQRRGDRCVRRREGPIRPGGHGGLPVHGSNSRHRPRHVQAPPEHGGRPAGLHAPQPGGRAERRCGRLLRQAVQGHLRRAASGGLQGLRSSTSWRSRGTATSSRCCSASTRSSGASS